MVFSAIRVDVNQVPFLLVNGSNIFLMIGWFSEKIEFVDNRFKWVNSVLLISSYILFRILNNTRMLVSLAFERGLCHTITTVVAGSFFFIGFLSLNVFWALKIISNTRKRFPDIHPATKTIQKGLLIASTFTFILSLVYYDLDNWTSFKQLFFSCFFLTPVVLRLNFPVSKKKKIVNRSVSENEEIIAKVWAQVLGLDLLDIRPDSDFFMLGGDSILAIHLVSSLRKLNIHLDAKDLFVHRKKSIDDDIFPCSPLQEAMFSSNQVHQGSFLEQIIWSFESNLMRDKVIQAWSKVVLKNDILRTLFFSTNNGIYQVVRNPTFMPLDLYLESSNLSLNAFLPLDKQRGFKEGILPWFRLTKIEGDVNHLVLTIHHLLYDGWSTALFFNDLENAFNGMVFSTTVSYKPYVQHIINENQEMSKKYWTQYLQGMSIPSFFNRIQNSEQFNSNKMISFLKVSHSKLNDACHQAHITKPVLLKAAWGLTLQKYYQTEDIVFGEVVSGRDITVPDIEIITGPTISTVPCRMNMKDKRLFSIFEQLLNDQIHRGSFTSVGIAKIESWCQQAGIIETLFVFQNFVGKKSDNEIITPSQFDRNQSVIYPIELTFIPEVDDIQLHFSYLISRLSVNIANDILETFNHIISQVVDACIGFVNINIQDLTVLPDQQVQRLLTFGQGAVQEIPSKRVDEVFEQLALLDPFVLAIEEGEKSISYGELNDRANELASYLITKGICVGDFVGVITTRSIDMVIGFLAVLKAGGAFIPIDSTLPLARLQYILEKSQCKYVMLRSMKDHQKERFGDSGDSYTWIDMESIKGMKVEEWNRPTVPLNSPAYAIFTSGSTGSPKGVVISHRSLTNYSAILPNIHGCKKGDRVGQFTSISFDVCLGDIFDTLCSHATLVLRSDDDPYKILKSVKIVVMTPTSLLNLDPNDYPNLEKLIVIGEALTETLQNTWSNKTWFINSYGPTECTIICSYTTIHQNEAITIGEPMNNTKHYIVDSSMNLVPVGVSGELVIGGAGVALGYLNQPELTSERFIDNIYTKDGTKMYRTGDICKWTETGQIQILGRTDDMIKLKGYRIELDEVALNVSKHPDVSAAAVVVKDDMMVAFLTPSSVNVEKLRDFVTDQLPHYMVPAVFQTLKEFPLNANGKIDKNQLKRLEVDSGFEAPMNENEIELSKIWSEILGVDGSKIGRHTSFFALGGDSIKVIQLVSVCRNIGWEISTSDVFRYQTISRIANVKPIELIQSKSTCFPVTTFQSLLLSDTNLSLNHRNQSVLLELKQSMLQDTLESKIRILVERHDTLRSRFEIDDTKWNQIIIEVENFKHREPLMFVVSNDDELDSALIDIQQTIDVRLGHVYSYGIIKYQLKTMLFITCHQLVIDSMSWDILLGDLDILLAGGELQKPSVTLQQWIDHRVQNSNLECIQQESHGCINSIQSRKPLSNPELFNDFTYKVLLSSDICSKFPQANFPLNTATPELVLMALIDSLGEFPEKNESIGFTFENNNRNYYNSEIDIEGIVGCFTKIIPVWFTIENKDMVTRLKELKDLIRKELFIETTKPLKQNTDQLKIRFKYVEVSKQSRWHHFEMLHNQDLFEIGVENLNDDDITIICSLDNGTIELKVEFYDNTIESYVKTWLDIWKQKMIELVMALCEIKDVIGLSSTDFNLLSNDFDMDVFETSILDLGFKLQDIEDIYPAGPFQEMFIVKCDADPLLPFSHDVYELQEPIDIEQFQQAFDKLYINTPLLRTTFCKINDRVYQFIRKPHTQFKITHVTDLKEYLHTDQKRGFFFGEPYWFRIAIHKGEKTHLILSISHALFDGWSHDTILQDLFKYYQGQIVSKRTSYKEYIRFILNRDQQEYEEFWKSYFLGFDGSHTLGTSDVIPQGLNHESIYLNFDLKSYFPALNRNGLTVALVLKASLSLTLQKLLGVDDIAFLEMLAARDIPLDGILSMFAPMINMVPCRVLSTKNQTIAELFESLQNSYSILSKFAHSYHTEIEQWSGVKSKYHVAFNLTIISDIMEQLTDLPLKPVEMESVRYLHELEVVGGLYQTHLRVLLKYHADVISRTRMIEFQESLSMCFKGLLELIEKNQYKSTLITTFK
ncbi:hypothetical protein BC833DRAFT_599394 [Globomyces pollinis-pini]|nr:hypothetical protein BC833DRAFT_599394 [Globomyces pollinis-pini]